MHFSIRIVSNEGCLGESFKIFEWESFNWISFANLHADSLASMECEVASSSTAYLLIIFAASGSVIAL